jgi:hypothetical protein
MGDSVHGQLVTLFLPDRRSIVYATQEIFCREEPCLPRYYGAAAAGG